jgi:hypothetical protein
MPSSGTDLVTELSDLLPNSGTDRVTEPREAVYSLRSGKDEHPTRNIRVQVRRAHGRFLPDRIISERRRRFIVEAEKAILSTTITLGQKFAIDWA